MTRYAPRSLLLLSLATLLITSGARQASARPSAAEIRQRVLANIQASKAAREGSGFRAWAEHERTGFRNMVRPKFTPQRTSFGPAKVPDGYKVHGGGSQPTTVFDKSSPKMKRYIRAKAAKLRMNNTMQPWDKVERLQKVIRGKVKHAGNELDFAKNPNKYTKYNHNTTKAGKLANLGDYLKMGKVVCREMAFLTQVALEDAGFEARLVRGDIMKNGKKVGGHAWNEIKVNGSWQIVDTTNPQFNKTDPQVALKTGTANGWIWKRDTNWYKVSRGPDLSGGSRW